jgi:hypothetical protein
VNKCPHPADNRKNQGKKITNAHINTANNRALQFTLLYGCLYGYNTLSLSLANNYCGDHKPENPEKRYIGPLVENVSNKKESMTLSFSIYLLVPAI